MAEQTVSITLKLKDGASKAMSRINRASSDLKKAFKQLGVGVAAIGAAGVAIAAMAKRGEELRVLENSFDALAASIGENSDLMLDSMRTASQGLVSDAELIQSANNAILLGLPVTTKGMGELAEAAIVLGRAMGVEATESIEKIIIGLGRMSVLRLDDLGITIDAEKANIKYAASIGKTTDQLDDGERKLAFYNATLDSMRSKVKEIGPIVLGFGGQIAVAKTSLINWKNELFIFTSAMTDTLFPAFAKVIGATDEFGKSINFSHKAAFDFVQIGLTTLLKTLSFLVNAFGFVQDVLNPVVSLFSIFQGVMLKTGELLLRVIIAPIDKMIQAFQLLLVVIGKAASALGLEGVGDKLQDAAVAVSNVRLGVDGMLDSIGELSAALIGTGIEGFRNFGKAGDAARRFADDIEGFTGTIEKITFSDLETALDGVGQEVGKLNNNIDKTKKKIEEIDVNKIKEGMAGVAEGATAAAEATAKIPEALKDAGETAKKVGEEIKEGAESGMGEGIVGAIAGGDVKAAVGNLGELLEGVAVLGIDIGAILSAITSINKDLPKLLFASLKALLINLVAELPLLIGNIIPDLVVPLLELVPVIIQRFVENLPVMIKAIILAIPSLIQAIISLGPNLVKAYFNMIDSALSEFFPNWWKEQRPLLMQTIADMVLRGIEELGNAWPSAWESMSNEITTWWERVIWKDLTEGLGGILSNLATQFDEEIIQPFADAIRLMWDQTFGKFPDMARDAGEFLAAPIREFLESFKWPEIKVPGIDGDGGGAKGVIEQITGVSFQQGTPFVQRTGPAILHRGEAVIPAEQNVMGAAAGGINLTINVDARGAAASDAEKLSRLFKNDAEGLLSELRRLLNRSG